MSDLLPLLITALRDKTLVDTEEELNELHKRVETATSIEIIHDATNEEAAGDDNNIDDDIVVYASGKFEDGNWGKNDNLWNVPVKNTRSNSDDDDDNTEEIAMRTMNYMFSQVVLCNLKTPPT